jgi:hypothetical protein
MLETPGVHVSFPPSGVSHMKLSYVVSGGPQVERMTQGWSMAWKEVVVLRLCRVTTWRALAYVVRAGGNGSEQVEHDTYHGNRWPVALGVVRVSVVTHERVTYAVAHHRGGSQVGHTPFEFKWIFQCSNFKNPKHDLFDLLNS